MPFVLSNAVCLLSEYSSDCNTDIFYTAYMHIYSILMSIVNRRLRSLIQLEYARHEFVEDSRSTCPAALFDIDRPYTKNKSYSVVCIQIIGSARV